MPNIQPKNNDLDTNSDIKNILRAVKGLTISQKSFGVNLKKDIDMANARTKNSNSVRDSRNRSKIALILTWSFVIIVAIIIIGPPIYNATIGTNTPVDQNRLLEVFSSLFGTILGFVLGYYFKDKNGGEKNND